MGEDTIAQERKENSSSSAETKVWDRNLSDLFRVITTGHGEIYLQSLWTERPPRSLDEECERLEGRTG